MNKIKETDMNRKPLSSSQYTLVVLKVTASCGWLRSNIAYSNKAGIIFTTQQ